MNIMLGVRNATVPLLIHIIILAHLSLLPYSNISPFLSPTPPTSHPKILHTPFSSDYSYKYNPAHPQPGALHWYRTSTALCRPHSLRRPPYMNPVPTFLQNCAPYKPPPQWTKPMFLIANKLPNKVKVSIQVTERSLTRNTSKEIVLVVGSFQ